MKNLFLMALILCSITTIAQTKKKTTAKEQKVHEKVVEFKDIQVVELKDSYDTDMVIAPIEEKELQDENTIYALSNVEVKPDFPGGMENLYKFLSKNIVYTDEMKEAEIVGKVFASFIVEKDGSITEVKVLREMGLGSGKEALRVLKMMPRWIPAQLNGKNVRCSYTIPISINASK